MNDTPLIAAATKGDLETVIDILYGDGIPKSLGIPDALINAAYGGYLEIVEALLPYCADINERPRGYITALDAAVHGLHANVVRLLISSGSDVNSKDGFGQTPLHRAVDCEVEYAKNWDNTIPADADIINILIDAGADVNAKTYMGETALDWAAGAGYRAAVDLLKQNGAIKSVV